MALMPKPQECSGCPLYGTGMGFSRPEGSGSLGVMIVGEALGENEEKDGLPFRPYAQSGSMLERLLRLCGYSRSQFTVWNVVACRPPKNWLDGAPYEAGAISQCQTHFRRVYDNAKPRVILAMGGVATRALTGESGKSRGVKYLRGYWFNTPWGWVLPTFHPQFLMRGEKRMIGVVAHDMKKAVVGASDMLRGREPAVAPVNYIQEARVVIADDDIPF